MSQREPGSCLWEQLVPGASEPLLPISLSLWVMVGFQCFPQINRCQWCSAMPKGAQVKAGASWVGFLFAFTLQLGAQLPAEKSPSVLHQSQVWMV